ncbi:MAG: polysaccharide deacetylase family protein [Candidatus Krumholzibacteria bacterium]|nr:polysaccharide deacetylase family protein [Candidatus Krumholzibacteria bacterium]
MTRSLLDIPKFRDYLGKRILLSVATDEKRVALTFDDGPNPRHTPALLDMLGAKGIRATFFVVGRWARKFPHLLERTVREGHEVGNHSDIHVPLSLLPARLIRREINVTERVIVGATGVRPRFLRPPMGWFNDKVLSIAKKMGYRPVIGSIHPRDSNKPGAKFIVDYVLPRVEPGGIIILHDGGRRVVSDRSQTVRAVDRISDQLLQHGYRFETMSELVR